MYNKITIEYFIPFFNKDKTYPYFYHGDILHIQDLKYRIEIFTQGGLIVKFLDENTIFKGEAATDELIKRNYTDKEIHASKKNVDILSESWFDVYIYDVNTDEEYTSIADLTMEEIFELVSKFSAGLSIDEYLELEDDKFSAMADEAANERFDYDIEISQIYLPDEDDTETDLDFGFSDLD